MNTRTKILTPADFAAIDYPRPVLLVTGRFDILRVELARVLAEARGRTAAQSLVAVLRPIEGELAPIAVRAEMAAALRVVDYVLTAEAADLDNLVAVLQPIEMISLEEADAERTQQLIEHVHRRQSS